MPPATAKVCAVVVTYHPPPLLKKNLEQLQPQVAEIVVVDNSSDPNTAERLLSIETSLGIRVIRNGKNLGIAAALNIGVRHAISAGYEWVATFDQDSSVTPAFFTGLFAAYHQSSANERVALIAPLLFYPASNETEVPRGGNLPDFSFVRTAITSGSLIRTQVFTHLGFYDEPMFIDYVDYDFCLRLQAAGYRLVRANRILLHHRLGTPEKHSLLGREISIKSHSAWRRYYITRNRVLVYRRYWFNFPRWCLLDFGWFIMELGKVLVFEGDKAIKLRNITKGLVHGLLGKTGQLVPPG